MSDNEAGVDWVGLIEHAEKFGEVDDRMIEAPDGGKALILSIPHGRSLVHAKPYFDEFRKWPERRKGTAVVTELASFIEHVQRFKDADSALFCVRRPAPSLLAVLDYHRPTATGRVSLADGGRLMGLPDAPPLDEPRSTPEGDARWGQHRTSYTFPLSQEWTAWTKTNKAPMAQGDFAAFVEDHILDIMDPADVGAGARKIADTLGSEFASPQRMLELSRGLTVREGTTVKNVVNLGTGEGQLLYDSVHQDERGAPLRVPGLFVIAIPVFEAGAAYQLPVRLRYRLAGGIVKWHYEIHRPDLSLDHAVSEAAEQARVATGLPLMYGAPEAS